MRTPISDSRNPCAKEPLRCPIVCCWTAILQIGVFHMNKSALLASTGIGLLLCIAPANAQMQQKGSEEKAAPQQVPATGQQKERAPAEKKAEPNGKGAAQGDIK